MNDKDGNDNKLYPTPLEARFERVITPFQEFIRDHTTGSLLLISCTLIALVIANSPLAHRYETLIQTPLGFIVGERAFKMSLHHLINEGLMSLFFFVLGLEIKREMLAGELKNPRQSLPVIAAAIGGMLIPALIFFALNANTATVHGWGIPMATDTAFAVGILALLGRRIPTALFAFLTALAIIDDLGAILVIAAFYTDTISFHALGFAALVLGVLIGCNAFGCRHPLVYTIGGGLVWLAMLQSGVHATVAGVLAALTVPARPKRGPQWFLRRTRKLLGEFESIEKASTHPILGEEEQHGVVEQVRKTAGTAMTPLRRWENALEHPVVLFVLPLFALANAGIATNPESLSATGTHVLGLGIILGLVAGKSIGITLFTWLALRLKLGGLPRDVNMRHIVGIGLLGGMGFTMSIFITGLGFADNPETLVTAKTAILLASLLAGLSGYLWLRFSGPFGSASDIRESHSA